MPIDPTEAPIGTPHSEISIDKHIAQARRIKRLEAQRNGLIALCDEIMGRLDRLEVVYASKQAYIFKAKLDKLRKERT